MMTMLVVDDEYYVRKGIRQTIRWEKYGIKIVDEACNGRQGLELVLKYKPDIVLTDIRMPFVDGLELMTKIRENGLDTEIIVLSGFEDFNYVKTALHSGASAYLLKPIDNEQLIETVQKVAAKIKEDRGTKQYYDKLKNELTSIKKQFLHDLISGALTDQNTICEKIQLIDIPIDINNNFVIVIKINQFQNIMNLIATEEIAYFKKAVLQHITQLLLLHTVFMGVIIDKSEEEWVVLLHLNESIELAVEIIKQRCLEVTERLKKEFSQTVSIGISELCKNIENISNAYKEACNACNYELLSCSNNVVYIKDKETTGYRREIRDAIKLIKNNYDKEITIDIAAKELYISSSYLMHLFKQDIGKTFSECLTDYRIQVAKELLNNPRYKIYEVSEKIGYADVKYFNKVFKKVTGMSPSDYIKQGT